MKRLLILVLSSTKPPYNELLRAQQATWDSVATPGVRTIYFYGSTLPKIKHIHDHSLEFGTGTSDEYNMMHWKFKKALDMAWFMHPFDFILRTNSSTYINKQLVLDFIQDLPTCGHYSGVNGGGFVSGTNALLSRDCADLLRKEMNSYPHPAEDVYMGDILRQAGIKISSGISRAAYDFETHRIASAHCYRCKSPTADRSLDVRAFHNIHSHLHKS